MKCRTIAALSVVLAVLIAGQTALAASYAYFRRLESTVGDGIRPGFRKVEGYITLPSTTNLTGVDQSGESAYNYFSIKVGANWPECGLFTAPAIWDEIPGWKGPGLGGGKWEVYHNSGTWTRDYWPAGGIPDGTRVFLRLYVPADNQLALYVSYGSNSHTFTYSVSGTKYDGTGHAFRKVTSLMTDDPGGKSTYNDWDTLKLYTSTTGYNWQDDYMVADIKSPDVSTKVQVVDTDGGVDYLSERVNIWEPQQ